jgi:hypothetical protein
MATAGTVFGILPRSGPIVNRIHQPLISALDEPHLNADIEAKAMSHCEI